PLLVSTVVSADPLYDRLLGKSQFANTYEIEKFILNLEELNKLQRAINGDPEVASDPSGQSFLDAVGSTEPVKPDLLPYLFEGDIILTEAQMNKTLHEKRLQALFKKLGKPSPVKRSLTADTTIRWTFPINYWIDTRTGVSYSAVQAGVAKWEELTCATFRQSNSQPYGVQSLRFVRGDGCYSYIGRASNYYGTQEVSIGTGCTSLGTVTHEIGHALGFYHEQARPERDDYVTVNFRNIFPDRQAQFTKQSYSSAINYGVEYDYGSVMHYDAGSFSANGQRTITTKDANYQSTIGQREEPSFADVKQINLAYCSTTCAGSTLDCQNGGYPDPKDCEICRCPPGLGGRLCDQVQPSLSPSCGDTDLTATIDSQQVIVAGDTDCYYRITAPAGRRVFVSFSTITFPGYTPCAYSYTEIKYRQNPVVSGARVCGSNRPSSATSEGQTMFVLYKGSSTSRLSFGYRFDPPTPVDSTVAPETTTSTAGQVTVPTGSTTTTTPTPTTTSTETTTTQTTTWPSWYTTVAPSVCNWSQCTAYCGGCGTQTRRCKGAIEWQYCATNPCPGNACCQPFTFILDGVCTRGQFPGTGGWNSEKPVDPLTNTVPEDEPTTTPYVTSEKDKQTLHIQPPDFPVTIDLPDELFRTEEKTLNTDANRIGLRALGESRFARPVQAAHRVQVVEGSGDAPTTGEEGLEIALNLDVEGSGEGSGEIDRAPATPTSATVADAKKEQTYSEIDKSMSKAVATDAEEKKIVAEYKEVKKTKETTSSSEEELAGSSHSRARRYVFPSAVPRLRLADERRISPITTRHG
ncbi:hypothetical protein PFISCL1PPCAC_8250, partial [Pristionchus fissidentatus]